MHRTHLAIVYISEGSNQVLINELTKIAKKQDAKLVHSFVDSIYNRTSYFFVGKQVAQSVLAFSSEALDRLDFRAHEGQHPALGAVDHVCFSPLGQSSIEESSIEATKFAKGLTSAHNDLPIYLYGHASNERLRDIRKKLGYFKANSTSTTMDLLSRTIILHPPAFGSKLNPKRGIMCVGSVPFVLNFNMRCRPEDTKTTVSRITASIRSPEVEALTLLHDGAYEVACNLLKSSSVTPEQVLAAANETADKFGAVIEKHYCTGPTEDELMTKFDRMASNDNE